MHNPMGHATQILAKYVGRIAKSLSGSVLSSARLYVRTGIDVSLRPTA